jgi:hypothetical protein
MKKNICERKYIVGILFKINRLARKIISEKKIFGQLIKLFGHDNSRKINMQDVNLLKCTF